MQKVLLKLKSLKVKKYDSLKGAVDLYIEYVENDKIKGVDKRLNLSENSILFAKNFLSEVKKQAKVMANLDSGNAFDSFVNVLFDEKEEGYTEEKLVNAINRIKERIKGFRSIKSADNYINRYHEVNNTLIEFR